MFASLDSGIQICIHITLYHFAQKLQLFSGKTDDTVVFSFDVASFLPLAVLYVRFDAKYAEIRRLPAAFACRRKEEIFSAPFFGLRRIAISRFASKFLDKPLFREYDKKQGKSSKCY